MVRENPNSTVAELVEAMGPKDGHDRVCKKSNVSNKLRHLKRFGLVDATPVGRGVEKRWYVVEISDS